MKKKKLKKKIQYTPLFIIFLSAITMLVVNQLQHSSQLQSSAQQGPKLLWAPPALTNPETITLGTGYAKVLLNNTKDYVIKMPSTKLNGNVRIDGGRNIVIIGGHMSVTTSAASNQEHAFRLSGQKGTVHIEGVLIDGSNGGEEDCFYLDTPDAIIQIENVRCVGIIGSESTNHSDVIQFHAGHKEARIDRLTASSYYQGIFIGEHDGKGNFGPIRLRNVNLSSLGNHYKTQLWMASSNHNYLMGYTIDFSNVWLKPTATSLTDETMLKQIIRPSISDKTPWRAVVHDGKISWPGIPDKVKGYVNLGTPPADFVPVGTAGLNYVSPGYEIGGTVGVVPDAKTPPLYCLGAVCPSDESISPTRSFEPSPRESVRVTKKLPATTSGKNTSVENTSTEDTIDTNSLLGAFLKFLIQLLTLLQSLFK